MEQAKKIQEMIPGKQQQPGKGEVNPVLVIHYLKQTNAALTEENAILKALLQQNDIKFQ